MRLERDRNDEIQCRAADWNLSSPDWTGRMRVMEKSQKVAKTEDCHAFRALQLNQHEDDYDYLSSPSIRAITIKAFESLAAQLVYTTQLG